MSDTNRKVYSLRFKPAAIAWLETVAQRHEMDTAEFARELFRLGSQHWQDTHPGDIDPAVQVSP